MESVTGNDGETAQWVLYQLKMASQNFKSAVFHPVEKADVKLAKKKKKKTMLTSSLSHLL